MASSAAQEGWNSVLRGSTLGVRGFKGQVFLTTALTDDRAVRESWVEIFA